MYNGLMLIYYTIYHPLVNRVCSIFPGNFRSGMDFASENVKRGLHLDRFRGRCKQLLRNCLDRALVYSFRELYLAAEEEGRCFLAGVKGIELLLSVSPHREDATKSDPSLIKVGM